MTLPEGAPQPNNAIRNRIAVVYSEEEYADILAEDIRGGGYEVDLFTDPVVAKEKIGSQHTIYSLVLTGWRMPRLSGTDMALDLYKIDPGIKIIVFSAFDVGTAEFNRIFDYKFDHMLMPFSTSELLERINNKINNVKLDESDIIRRHRLPLPPESKDHYRKINDTDWKKKLIQIGAPFAGMYIVIMILRSLGLL
jgi:DNA-binding NtrC family response regulator